MSKDNNAIDVKSYSVSSNSVISLSFANNNQSVTRLPNTVFPLYENLKKSKTRFRDLYLGDRYSEKKDCYNYTLIVRT